MSKERNLRTGVLAMAATAFAMGTIIGGIFLNAAGFFSPRFQSWPPELLGAWGSILGGIGSAIAAFMALAIANRQRAATTADRIADERERRRTAHRRAIALALGLDLDLASAGIVAKNVFKASRENWSTGDRLKMCTRFVADVDLTSLERAVLYVENFDPETAVALTQGLATLRFFVRVPKLEEGLSEMDLRVRVGEMQRRSATARMAIYRVRRMLLPYVDRQFVRAEGGRWSHGDYWATHLRD